MPAWISSRNSGCSASTRWYSLSVSGLPKIGSISRGHNAQMMAALFPGLGSVASFSTQVSSTTRKIGAGLAQSVFAPFGFHKTDGFRLAHAPPLVLFPSDGKAGRELQLD